MENIYKPDIICIGSEEKYDVRLYNTRTKQFIPEGNEKYLHYILICDNCRIDYYGDTPWSAINFAKRHIETKGRGTAKGKVIIKLKDTITQKEFLAATVEKTIKRQYINCEPKRKRGDFNYE